MLIARRADTRARADFATWKMLAKLNGTSSLPAEAQNFLAGYKALLEKMAEAEASEATIQLIYRSYYARNGRGRHAARRQGPVNASDPARQRTTSPPSSGRAPKPAKDRAAGPAAKPRLPVALIFICLVVVYVGVRYFWR